MRWSAEGPRLAYRAFTVNEQGRLAGVPQIIEALSDGEAARQAECLAEWHGVELWEGARLVARVAPRTRLVHQQNA